MAATTELLGAQGVRPSDGLLGHVQRIGALNVFARAFPVWVHEHRKLVSVSIQARADGAVAIELGLPPGASPEEADHLLEVLEKCQRLSDLEVIVSELRQSGVEDAIVQRYAIEAETLARQLYPPA